MNKPIRVQFNGGLQQPAKIGSVVLRPTGQGKLSYAQNVDSSNDEYGDGTITPGPKLANITGNGELTGVPLAATGSYYDNNTDGFIYIVQGLLGAAKNVIRRIKGVTSSGTPTIEAADADTPATYTDLAYLTDTLLFQETSGNAVKVLLTGWSSTANGTNSGKIGYIQAANGSNSVTDISASGGYINGFEPLLMIGDDKFPYWTQNGYTLARVAKDLSGIATAFSLRRNQTMCALGKFQQYAAIAYFEDSSPIEGFNKRKIGGQTGLLLWNYIDTAFFERDIPFPNNYISAIVQDLSGNTLVFGGLDQGKTTLYMLTGSGFTPLVSYVGDMPRNRHSVDFDAQGRVLWQTCNGQILRYDQVSEKLDHLASIACDAGAGGILKRLQGTTNDFMVAAGTGSTYTLKVLTFGSYIGDGDAGTDNITTPLAISGQQFMPAPNATISAITLHLTKPLATSEQVKLRVYANGSTTPTDYMDMEFAVDGAISSKRVANSLPDINNFALGIAWKQTDALATAPPVVFAEVEYEINQ